MKKYHLSTRKVKCFSLLLIGYMASHTVQAGIPVTDPSLLGNAIVKNILEFAEWGKEEIRNQANNYLQQQLASLGFENEASVARDQLAFETSFQSNMFNLQLKREMKPSPTACSTIAHTVIAKQSKKNAQCFAASQQSDFIEANNTFNIEPEEKRKRNEQIVTHYIEKCNGLTKGAFGPLAADDDIDLKSCLNTGLLVSPEKSQLSGKDLSSAELMTNIIAGIGDPVSTSPNMPNNIEGNYRRLLDMRRIQFKALINASLKAVLSDKYSDGQTPSYLATLEDFVQKRNFNADWVAKMTGVHEDETTYQSQLLREIAAMNAFSASVQVARYKQEMRKESLLAALLALEYEPLTK